MSGLGVWWISNARSEHLYSPFWGYWQTKGHGTAPPLERMNAHAENLSRAAVLTQEKPMHLLSLDGSL